MWKPGDCNLILEKNPIKINFIRNLIKINFTRKLIKINFNLTLVEVNFSPKSIFHQKNHFSHRVIDQINIWSWKSIKFSFDEKW